MIESLPAYVYGLPLFLMHFSLAVVLTLLFAVIYHKLTPHHEWALMLKNNVASAVAFSGSLIGFVLPLASAISNSVDVIDSLVWGLVAFTVQILTFFGLRMMIRDLSERLTANEISSGIFVAAVSISAGLLNAACMTY